MKSVSVKTGFKILDSRLLLILLVSLTSCKAIALDYVPQEISPKITVTTNYAKEKSPTIQKTTEPTLTPTPTPSPEICEDIEGQILDLEIDSDHLINSLRTYVYLPPCYESDQQDTYPYLILLHGQSMTNEIWLDLGILEITNTLISNDLISPILIFMPKEENYFLDPWDSEYDKVILDDLIPWIDKSYKTCPKRECRAVGGISRGAAWAMRLGLIHWDLFGAVGAHSYPVFRGDYNRFPQWNLEIPEEQKPKVYIDIGTLDRFIEPASQFEALMTKYHYPHEWHVNNGKHDENYWSKYLPDYLIWYGTVFANSP